MCLCSCWIRIKLEELTHTHAHNTHRVNYKSYKRRLLTPATQPFVRFSHSLLIFDGVVCHYVKAQLSQGGKKKEKEKKTKQCPLWPHCWGEQSRTTNPCQETILKQETDTEPLPVQSLNLGTAANPFLSLFG